jgi:DNA-directed RNA polymerase specialized sigma subunit
MKLKLRPLTAKQRRLVEENLPFVNYVMAHPRYRSFSASLGLDEAKSVAQMEFVMRARTFDPSKGLKFGTYAMQAIDSALRDAALRRQRQMPLGAEVPAAVRNARCRGLEPDMEAVVREAVGVSADPA